MVSAILFLSSVASGEYPVLRVNDRLVIDFDDYVDVLRHSGQDVVLDGELTTSDRAQFDAFSAFLQQNLNPALVSIRTFSFMVLAGYPMGG